jgi:hypothetical protein
MNSTQVPSRTNPIALRQRLNADKLHGPMWLLPNMRHTFSCRPVRNAKMTDVDRHASLIAAHETRLRALLTGDLKMLKTVVGKDMVFISSAGGTTTRADVIAAYNAGTMQIMRMDASDISTRIYGDIGILIYTADGKTRHGETTVEGMTRSTTVYAFRDGGWQMISQHQSRIE